MRRTYFGKPSEAFNTPKPPKHKKQCLWPQKGIRSLGPKKLSKLANMENCFELVEEVVATNIHLYK